MTDVGLTMGEAFLKALELYNAGDFKEAKYLLRSILMVDREDFNAHNLLGAIAAKERSFFEAYYHFNRTLVADPNAPQALSNTGMMLAHFEHFAEAEAVLKRAIEVGPDDPATLNNYGTILLRNGRENEAIEVFERVFEMDPDKGPIHFNLGVSYLRSGELPKAIFHLSEAVARGLAGADAHYNLGIAKLSVGDLAGGWPEYEWRTAAVDGPYYMGPFKEPKYDGSQDLTGKTILVHAEQGMGDSIQFMRYVPLLKQRGAAHVLMIMHKPLYRLAHSIGAEILPQGSPIPKFDYWMPSVSAALAFKTTEATIPPPAPFKFDPSKFKAAVDAAASNRLKVGVCWSGNWQHKNDLHRSIDLGVFKQLFSAPGVAFFNLQKDVRPMEADEFNQCHGLIDLTGQIADVADTASLISTLDLVISCDTCVAHLAGGLVPTWNLIPNYNSDWRWMKDRRDSPWYPNMRLYRQSRPGQDAWAELLQVVATDLAATERMGT